jgi:hypothetical protein
MSQGLHFQVIVVVPHDEQLGHFVGKVVGDVWVENTGKRLLDDGAVACV